MAATDITSLPAEILGEIIRHCSFYCADAPIILASVNRLLYDVAHGTPCVWSKLRLSLSNDERRLVRKAGLWFTRSGSCLLDLFVDVAATSEDSPTDSPERPIAEVYHFLVAFLRHHRPQIQTLNVKSDTELKAFHFIDAIYSSSYFPPANQHLQLQSLRIRITNDIPQAPSTWSPVFESFSHLPSLQSLKLTNHVLPALNTPTIANLRYLTISRPLRAHPLPVHKILRIISSTPALTQLEIDSRIMKQPLSELTQYMTIPELESLSLRTNNLPYLLRLLGTSSLKKLYLKDLDGKRVTANQELGLALKELSERTVTPDGLADGLSNLHTLEITGIIPGDERMDHDWELCIRRMIKLERLVISDFDAEGLVDLLTENSLSGFGLGPVCPRLKYLCLSGVRSLPSLQRLKMSRSNITIEWETTRQETPRAARSSVYAYGAGGFGFGSRFNFERRTSNVESGNFRNTILRLEPDSDGTW
ncbi:hypothetical protein K435DRAFT_402405 [Dendrothele bispora CBS 962.96]|uniref:F-box domain-containing protein n=1 Tax=Dendrothele bispora (strain CBS 962.96) TaxID=1314807 RepID=A0A4S8MFL9_DENBC|nr:hypothetical protein K435DRAFT_402405 [Dendrothele bispora CBS 962.96]